MVVGLVNQRSGEHKYVKVGFSWVLLFFSGVLGIPLFLRRLYVWGAVLALWALYVFSPQILPDTAHSAGTYLSLCLVFLALQIWIAVKGNEMTAKNLLENGWSFSSPNAQKIHYAMMKWIFSNNFAPEHSQIQVPQPFFSQRAPTHVSLPEPQISEPIFRHQLRTRRSDRLQNQYSFQIFHHNKKTISVFWKPNSKSTFVFCAERQEFLQF